MGLKAMLYIGILGLGVGCSNSDPRLQGERQLLDGMVFVETDARFLAAAAWTASAVALPLASRSSFTAACFLASAVMAASAASAAARAAAGGTGCRFSS